MVKRLLFMTAILVGGALAPPTLLAEECLLFAGTYWNTTRLDVFEMDGQANLSFRQTLEVGDGVYLNTSPTGRTVVASGVEEPTLSLFFIGDDGSIAPPLYLDNPTNADPQHYDSSANKVAFHRTLPFFYAGSTTLSLIRFDENDQTAELVGLTNTAMSYVHGLGFSREANRLIGGIKTAYQAPEGNLVSKIRSLEIMADGTQIVTVFPPVMRV